MRLLQAAVGSEAECETTAALVLSFRSTALVVAFFASPDHRSELQDCAGLLRRIRRRVGGCGGATTDRTAGHRGTVRFGAVRPSEPSQCCAAWIPLSITVSSPYVHNRLCGG